MKSAWSLTVLICVMVLYGHSQKVGVVLSGGGASAMAHVGFLKALEENNIPIDYVTGTSMGAIIGGMYASGLTVAQIDSIVRSKDYQNMAEGELDERYRYFFKEPMPDAAMGTIKLGGASLFSTTLPTNLVNPVLLDYKLMEGFSQADAAANYDFDSLYIPFRCVAADIELKEQVIFDKGHLNVAVRASSTYPFYLHPIRVDGKLLYDGGLYNNFPVELMDETFHPDVIIGCNVSGYIEPPSEDDLFSQLENMIRVRKDYTACCEQVFVVEPETALGTFDFDEIPQAVNDGYKSTMAVMDSIKAQIFEYRSVESKDAERAKFRSKFFPLIFDEISIDGLEKAQRTYVRRLLGRNGDSLTINDLKIKYFQTFADEKIKSIFPITMYNPGTDRFKLLLNVKKDKDLFLSFGGNFSSRPINTGYVGLRYNIFRARSATLYANSYFGKYYGSVHARLKFDFSGTIPWSIEPGFTSNRWDYFRSFATFFEDVKPSFIVINEQFAGVNMKFPTGNKGAVELSGNYAQLDYDYYRNQTFLSTDTADRTRFNHGVFQMTWERNTLNRKQYANNGTRLLIKAKGVTGKESSFPGNTSSVRDTTFQDHSWGLLRLEYTNYFQTIGKLKFGLRVEGVASTQSFFNNYISSVIAAPSFRPIP